MFYANFIILFNSEHKGPYFQNLWTLTTSERRAGGALTFLKLHKYKQKKSLWLIHIESAGF